MSGPPAARSPLSGAITPRRIGPTSGSSPPQAVRPATSSTGRSARIMSFLRGMASRFAHGHDLAILDLAPIEGPEPHVVGWQRLAGSDIEIDVARRALVVDLALARDRRPQGGPVACRDLGTARGLAHRIADRRTAVGGASDLDGDGGQVRTVVVILAVGEHRAGVAGGEVDLERAQAGAGGALVVGAGRDRAHGALEGRPAGRGREQLGP